MKIPKRFKLFSHTIEVFDNPCQDFNEGASGMAYYRTRRIGLQTHCPEHPLLEDDRERIFLHEMTHHILHSMERHELNDDELFVNMFANFLHQALTTMEYEEISA